MPKLFSIGVKGLIRNSSGQYLLLKANVTNHSKGTQPYWDIPGGRIEENEDAITALRREIQEEIGVAQLTDITFLTAIISNHQIPLKDGTITGLALFVYTVAIPQAAQINIRPAEHDEYGWFSADKAAILLSNKYPTEFTSKLN